MSDEPRIDVYLPPLPSGLPAHSSSVALPCRILPLSRHTTQCSVASPALQKLPPHFSFGRSHRKIGARPRQPSPCRSLNPIRQSTRQSCARPSESRTYPLQ